MSKYIQTYLTSIQALSPYELSHTIIPVTCHIYWVLTNGINHFLCTWSFIQFKISYYVFIDGQPNLIAPGTLLHPHPQITALANHYETNSCNVIAKSSGNPCHASFNGISHHSLRLGACTHHRPTWLRLTCHRGIGLRAPDTFSLLSWLGTHLVSIS